MVYAGKRGSKRFFRQTLARFEGDAVIEKIQEEGRKIREAERWAARQESES